MDQHFKKEIDNLPPLPESVREIERVYHDADSSFDALKHVIEQDPMLTANILKVANSPFYGFDRQITSIKQAISLFGKDMIRCFALDHGIRQSFTIDLSAYGITPESFKLSSEKQLSLVMHWLFKKESRSISLLAPAAFLVDLGRIVISRHLISTGRSSLIPTIIAEGESIETAESTACGTTATDITATIFNHWHFEANLIALIRHAEQPETLTGNERRLAAQLKAVRETVTCNGEITEASLARARETIAAFDLDIEAFEGAVTRIANL